MSDGMVKQLLDRVQQDDRLALSRLLSEVENETPAGMAALAELYPQSGNAHRIGITGPPGSGKSTLVSKIASYYQGHPSAGSEPRTAVIAVDPTSPISGGALLGDRIRMRELSGHEGVFIRSMASRGESGGLARMTAQVADVLDSVGYDPVLIETVGAGQAEVAIAASAQTCLLVEAPGAGDDVQAIKAGILEVADILVVNKADLPGSDQTVTILRQMLHLRNVEEHDWQIPVVPVVSTTGEGVTELVHQIQAHRAYLDRTGSWREHARMQAESRLEQAMKAALYQRLRQRVGEETWLATVDQIASRTTSPQEAAARLLEGWRT